MVFSRLTGFSCNQLIRVSPLSNDPLQLLHLHTVTGMPVSTFFLAYGDHIVENSSMSKTDIRSQSKSNWSKKLSTRLAPRPDIFVLWKRPVTDQRPESAPWAADALREDNDV
ncbi:hypothetical protein pipiens_018731 [Culex pipiens pipiens]|uniref:Uncharacterized protein n=1 Tax=Culex pipiens pipiens TaxID=38569 RepID=A0ABD1DZ87_CULPP